MKKYILIHTTGASEISSHFFRSDKEIPVDVGNFFWPEFQEFSEDAKSFLAAFGITPNTEGETICIHQISGLTIDMVY
jgi:hypothetical protein